MTCRGHGVGEFLTSIASFEADESESCVRGRWNGSSTICYTPRGGLSVVAYCLGGHETQ